MYIIKPQLSHRHHIYFIFAPRISFKNKQTNKKKEEDEEEARSKIPHGQVAVRILYTTAMCALIFSIWSWRGDPPGQEERNPAMWAWGGSGNWGGKGGGEFNTGYVLKKKTIHLSYPTTNLYVQKPRRKPNQDTRELLFRQSKRVHFTQLELAFRSTQICSLISRSGTSLLNLCRSVFCNRIVRAVWGKWRWTEANCSHLKLKAKHEMHHDCKRIVFTLLFFFTWPFTRIVVCVCAE